MCQQNFVNDKIFDNFLSVFLSKVANLKTGCGFEADVQIGPLTNKAAANRYEKLIVDLKGSEQFTPKRKSEEDLIFEPTVAVSARTNIRAFDEEIFGPLAVIYKFKTDSEAIQLSNATNYGLASYLFTESKQAIKYYTDSLDFGIVSVNAGAFSNSVAPFGGFKESGVGEKAVNMAWKNFRD